MFGVHKEWTALDVDLKKNNNLVISTSVTNNAITDFL